MTKNMTATVGAVLRDVKFHKELSKKLAPQNVTKLNQLEAVLEKYKCNPSDLALALLGLMK